MFCFCMRGVLQAACVKDIYLWLFVNIYIYIYIYIDKYILSVVAFCFFSRFVSTAVGGIFTYCYCLTVTPVAVIVVKRVRAS